MENCVVREKVVSKDFEGVEIDLLALDDLYES